ncbi:hypothetical protein [Streptomyces turgidiscabies]|uniref:hypothetical protein n=1 Tax=Streptomyces turgidiscabies TaxID=85558 RepID=UPI0027D862E2|nr:hypothetical protein [Streptomyces turgidiscabies]
MNGDPSPTAPALHHGSEVGESAVRTTSARCVLPLGLAVSGLREVGARSTGWILDQLAELM